MGAADIPEDFVPRSTTKKRGRTVFSKNQLFFFSFPSSSLTLLLSSVLPVDRSTPSQQLIPNSDHPAERGTSTQNRVYPTNQQPLSYFKSTGQNKPLIPCLLPDTLGDHTNVPLTRRTATQATKIVSQMEPFRPTQCQYRVHHGRPSTAPLRSQV